MRRLDNGRDFSPTEFGDREAEMPAASVIGSCAPKLGRWLCRDLRPQHQESSLRAKTSLRLSQLELKNRLVKGDRESPR